MLIEKEKEREREREFLDLNIKVGVIYYAYWICKGNARRSSNDCCLIPRSEYVELMRDFTDFNQCPN